MREAQQPHLWKTVIAECYADPTKAKNELGWVAEYGIEEMCADSWNWQKNNPDGYHTVK